MLKFNGHYAHGALRFQKKVRTFFDRPRGYVDPDGAACALVMKRFANEHDLEHESVGFEHDSLEAQKAFLREYAEPDATFVFTDITPKPELAEWMVEEGIAANIIILDHHKTGADDYADVDIENVHVDINLRRKSAVEHVQKTLFPGEKVPLLFKKIAMAEPPTNPETLDDLYFLQKMSVYLEENKHDVVAAMERLMTLSYQELVAEGREIDEAKASRITQLYNRVNYLDIPAPDGHRVILPVVHSQEDLPSYGWRIGGRACYEAERLMPGFKPGEPWKKPGVSAVFVKNAQRPGGKLKFRSPEGSDVDCAVLVRTLVDEGIAEPNSGGGTHAAVATLGRDLKDLGDKTALYISQAEGTASAHRLPEVHPSLGVNFG